MNTGVDSFIQLLRHPVKFRMFLFTHLPAAYFSGVRVRELDGKHCITSVPYKWFTRNPFRSTYFACLSMAAEMSTGALAMSHLFRRNPPVSMLVVKVESEYFKKATGKTVFTCTDGDLIRQAIEESVSTGESRVVRAGSTGRNKDGEIVAEFYVTWSFKVKSKA